MAEQRPKDEAKSAAEISRNPSSSQSDYKFHHKSASQKVKFGGGTGQHTRVKKTPDETIDTQCVAALASRKDEPTPWLLLPPRVKNGHHRSTSGPPGSSSYDNSLNKEPPRITSVKTRPAKKTGDELIIDAQCTPPGSGRKDAEPTIWLLPPRVKNGHHRSTSGPPGSSSYDNSLNTEPPRQTPAKVSPPPQPRKRRRERDGKKSKNRSKVDALSGERRQTGAVQLVRDLFLMEDDSELLLINHPLKERIQVGQLAQCPAPTPMNMLRGWGEEAPRKYPKRSTKDGQS